MRKNELARSTERNRGKGLRNKSLKGRERRGGDQKRDGGGVSIILKEKAKLSRGTVVIADTTQKGRKRRS